MCSVLEVTKYVIAYEASRNRHVSNLRLQKLLYFVQAQFLLNRNEPCFSEEIEAWNFGPVVPEVYHEYKGYGSSNINCRDPKSLEILDDNEKELANAILDQCAEYTTSQLVELTHAQDPWKIAYAKPFGNNISKESIRNFFYNED